MAHRPLSIYVPNWPRPQRSTTSSGTRARAPRPHCATSRAGCGGCRARRPARRAASCGRRGRGRLRAERLPPRARRGAHGVRGRVPRARATGPCCATSCCSARPMSSAPRSVARPTMRAAAGRGCARSARGAELVENVADDRLAAAARKELGASSQVGLDDVQHRRERVGAEPRIMTEPADVDRSDMSMDMSRRVTS